MAETLNRQQLLEITSQFKTYFFRMVLVDGSDDTAIVYGPGVNETVSIQECKSAADLHQVFVKSTLALSKQIEYELGCEVAIAFEGAKWRAVLGSGLNVTRQLIPSWRLDGYADAHAPSDVEALPISWSGDEDYFKQLTRKRDLAGALAELYLIGVRPLRHGKEVYWESWSPYFDGELAHWTASGAIFKAAVKLHKQNAPKRDVWTHREFLGDLNL